MNSILSLDLGAGNTKILATANGKLILDLVIPSAVGLVDNGSLSGFTNGTAMPHEALIKIGNNDYRVSLRSNQELPRYKRASPHDDYQRSAHHDALLIAALRATGLSRIDILVLGTPVHTYAKHATHLTKWKGYHELGPGSSVDIRRVLVAPQPFGSLTAAKKEGIIDPREHINHLVIDPGFYSTDVLKTRGYELDQPYCFGLAFGTATIYRKIADLLANSLKKPVIDIDRIEHSVRTGLPCQIHGQTFNLRESYLPQIEAYIEECVLQIYSRLESTEDISSILLTGGGCDLFENSIRKAFRDIEIIRMPDPIRANARGYMIAGRAALGG
jgi:plasmid segregation protein ParM